MTKHREPSIADKVRKAAFDAAAQTAKEESKKALNNAKASGAAVISRAREAAPAAIAKTAVLGKVAAAIAATQAKKTLVKGAVGAIKAYEEISEEVQQQRKAEKKTAGGWFRR